MGWKETLWIKRSRVRACNIRWTEQARVAKVLRRGCNGLMTECSS